MTNTHAQTIVTIEKIEGMQATYSPEDNKLRLYAPYRLDEDLYKVVRAYGFIYAPKQELFVAPAWTPQREDLCFALAGEVEPEETTLAERAEAKAERLEAAAQKKMGLAQSYINTADELSRAFEMGQPILVGHHSERRARRTQERMDANMRKGLAAEKGAAHCLSLASGAEAHANYKNKPAVRARRIKTLLTELRDLQRGLNHAQKALKCWNKAESDEQIKALVNAGYISSGSLTLFEDYQALIKNELTPQEVKERNLKAWGNVFKGRNRRRCIEHVLNRLAYERELLGPVTRFKGELSAAVLQTFARTHGADKPKAKALDDGRIELSSRVDLPAHMCAGLELKSLTLSVEGWRNLMQDMGYEVPAKAPAKAPILNFQAETLSSPNQYHRGEVITYDQVTMTKAEYAAIHKDYRGVRLSTCGQFRFKVCYYRKSGEPFSSRELVAVFLSDSKAHPAPESEAIDRHLKAKAA
ncbi:DUF3560 domain-containing protein [Polycladidibacter hongkongensis]|uniref:DUF3560 domain-containing protein n=1 Tax=Polycladidibacter hongkongensis TaxID=1647556 RepID=UPI000A8AD7CA|nr:DUF3560 domain-containing protein [Pseudovibrio hongkongensis]